uniref:Secreted peptide n=1 Tax=Anguilla anguilla TaxID=7936 RepID=A0A0E9WT09_ANGAN
MSGVFIFYTFTFSIASIFSSCSSLARHPPLNTFSYTFTGTTTPFHTSSYTFMHFLLHCNTFFCCCTDCRRHIFI